MDTTWKDRVLALESWGWTLTAIGRAVGLTVQAISDIKQGRTAAPIGMAAVKLHKLHRNAERRVRRAA